ncbi:MAG: formate--phosphoribosylaminoimidazolecarboxamide ligase family protein [Candidatus Thermoplasmatota archaeon]
MITQDEIRDVVNSYKLDNISIGVLGGHSALDICRGAKKHGFHTIAVCQKGREKTYDKYYKSRPDGRGCVDETIILSKFSDILKEEVQDHLRRKNTIFVHNRYFWVYFDFNDIESRFKVPIYGSRTLLRAEERNTPKNQYYLLERAGIRYPRIYNSPEDIDRLVIVKVNEAMRGYERAFFFAVNYEDYKKKSSDMLKRGYITKEGLDRAIIEEYIVGAQINFNYFYSVIDDELEIMGTDIRRQTNLDGLLRLPADEQLEVLRYVKPRLIETGHIAATTKESIIEHIFDLGERFVGITKEEYPPGIIGPFALQGAIVSEKGKEEMVVFDVSMRIPGSPLTMFTPHTAYLYGESISYGERIALEIKKAVKQKRLKEIVT